jgi:sugar phosphate isomerase/epimerase
MWTLSGFADEISPDLDKQCAVITGLGMKYVEFRSAWDTNVLDLSDEQLAASRAMFRAAGLRVSSIGSPIGKIFIDEPFEPHLERARHAVQVAELFDAPYIRVFSFFLRPGADAVDHRDEVLRRMSALAELVAGTGIVLLHENEKEIFGDVPERCLDLVESVGSPDLRVAWDAANFVQVGVRPFTQAYAMLRPHIEYVQIKDARLADGGVVPAGQGDGQIVETIRALRDDGYDGYFSLEPHLSQARTSGGFSGPDLFTTAWRAFTAILDDERIDYA